MAASSSFDYLVAELSGEERRLLLERIKTSMPVSSEPLFSARAAPGAGSPPMLKVDELGIIPRFILFLRVLFSGKSRDELLREDELKEIGRRIEQRQAGIIDRRRGIILSPVADELRGLRDSSRFFYDALDHSVERDKGAFYAFLASIELPETHERLLAEADPASIAEAIDENRGGPDPDEQAVRTAAFAAYEAIFAELSDRGRRAMYQDLRSVLFLKRLSSFLFDRLIGTFKEGAGPESQPAASFFDARELLLELGDILFSMSEPPSTTLMEAIFVFADREELGKKESDAEAVLGADMAKAEAALGKIRSFNERVPLGDLLRLASGDPGYLPSSLPGGEDWLVIYKAFWRERIEASLEEWRSKHRNKELADEIASFVGELSPAGFANISHEEREDAPAIRLDVALSFLDAFYRGPFLRELNRPMKIVLVDGEFYRKDNRVEYTDAYDALLRIPELLSAFDARLGPEGELGASWRSAESEMGPPAVKRRRMQSVSRSAEEEAERIIQRVGSALRTMTLILQGFLKGEAGGRYDSLANLSHIDGKSNKEFLRSLERAKDRCEKAHSLLAELSGLDLSWGE
jgi:hypothetical protein